ncbi:MAG: ROK family protein [Thermovirgaceae bacterium]|nr:ROK family protein [Thermovirgaceae bacterium]
MKSLGIDLGGHFLKGALVEEGAIAKRQKISTPRGRDPEEIVAAISAMIQKLDAEGSAVSVGIGFPGMLDRTRETVLQAPNFPLLENYPFRTRTQETCRRKVLIENDANCAALGELACGGARGLSDFIMLTLGTGIGGGIVSGGHLFTGAHGKAGEMGHVPVGEEALCACGAPGHAEALFGADALKKAFAEAGIKGGIPDLWLRRGEPGVTKVWDLALDALARAIAAAVHILDPQAVILGGGLSRSSGLLETLRPLVLRHTAPPFRETLDLRLSLLGDDAALIGAAGLGKTIRMT